MENRKIECSSKKLGRGRYGHVFEGVFEGRPVAVKRVMLENIDSTGQEEEILRKLKHPNVLKLFYAENYSEFRFFALELCQASLRQLFLKDGDKEKYSGLKPTEENILIELALGLEYIHGQSLVHRDLKPDNALIWVGGGAAGEEIRAVMKWADFGLSKPVNERGTYTMSGVKGTELWFAPEILELMYNQVYNNEAGAAAAFPRGTIQSDIFAEGLTLAYSLLGGIHPYGNPFQIMSNLKEHNAVNLKNIGVVHGEDLHEMLVNMLKTDPSKRLTAKGVVERLLQIFHQRNKNIGRAIAKVRFAETALDQCSRTGYHNGLDLYSIPLTKTYEIGSVAERYSFGENAKSTGKLCKTMILMGATGSGKTTLINAMMNYIFNVQWEDNFRFQMIEEKEVGRWQVHHSQTSKITVYDIHHQEGFRVPHSLTIVDTPGYGDIKGPTRDQEITEMLRQFFNDENGIQELDVVGVVINASIARLTPTQRYIFDSVLSVFVNDVKDNINFLFTFADSNLPPALNAITEAGVRLWQMHCPTDDQTRHPLHHKFNCSGFFCSNRGTGIADRFNKLFWRMGIDNFDNLYFKKLPTLKTKSLLSTKQVLEARKQLETTVDVLTPLVETGFTNMGAIKGKVEKVKEIIARLDKVLLRPNPLSSPHYITMVIEEERIGKRPGCANRIKSLEELRAKAKITSKILRS